MSLNRFGMEDNVDLLRAARRMDDPPLNKWMTLQNSQGQTKRVLVVRNGYGAWICADGERLVKYEWYPVGEG